MGHYTGRVSELRLGVGGHPEVSIVCPALAIPRPGQFILASDAQDVHVVLGTPLFMIEMTTQGFWASPLRPCFWSPGTSLDMVGPLGHGFSLPGTIQRLGLVAVGETVSRLLPIIHQVAATQAALTLFTDLDIPMLPSSLEVAPLVSIFDALDWPDFMALDVPISEMGHLRQVLGIFDSTILPCPAQVLVTSPMPCVGMGRCGACTIQGRRGWKLVCEDGPVFDLSSLDW